MPSFTKALKLKDFRQWAGARTRKPSPKPPAPESVTNGSSTLVPPRSPSDDGEWPELYALGTDPPEARCSETVTEHSLGDAHQLGIGAGCLLVSSKDESEGIRTARENSVEPSGTLKPARESHPDTSSCQVCKGLRPIGGKEGKEYLDWLVESGLAASPNHTEVRTVLVGDDAFHDYVWTKGHTPAVPLAAEWVKSAMSGCGSCQIVVEGASSFVPFWFMEIGSNPERAEDDSTRNKYIVAFNTFDDQPLQVVLINTKETWACQRHICLEIFTHPDNPPIWPTIGAMRPVAFKRGDSQYIDTIKAWLQDCVDTHNECRKPASDFMPTRLLALSPGKKRKRPKARLVEGADIVLDRFVALSYCWGLKSPEWIITTKANIAQHRSRLSVKILPDAVREAIILALDLGYQYIWIDALCIIQDDAQDWAKEAASMTDVYTNAHLVIGNNAAWKCTLPIFTVQGFGASHMQNVFTPPAQDEPYKPHFMRENGSAAGYWGHYDDTPWRTDLDSAQMEEPIYDYEYDDPLPYVRISSTIIHGMMPGMRGIQPLNSRGWCLQENLLATRYLDLGYLEMSWRCIQANRCECGFVRQQKKQLMYYVEKPGPAPRELIPRYPLDLDTRCLSTLVDTDCPYNPEWNILTFINWMGILSQFSGRNLTQGKDGLVAIMGLVQAYEIAAQRLYGASWNFWNGIPLSSFQGPQSPRNIEFLLWFRTEDGSDPSSVPLSWDQWPYSTRRYTLPLNFQHLAAILNDQLKGLAHLESYYDIGTVETEIRRRRKTTGDAYFSSHIFNMEGNDTLFPSWHMIGRCGRPPIGNTSEAFTFVRLQSDFAYSELNSFLPCVQIHEMQMDDITIPISNVQASNADEAYLKLQNVSGPPIPGLASSLPGGRAVSGQLTLSGPFMPVKLRSAIINKLPLKDDGRPFSLHTVLRGAIECELHNDHHYFCNEDDECFSFWPDARHVVFGDLEELRDEFPCTARVVKSLQEISDAGDGPDGFYPFYDELIKSRKHTGRTRPVRARRVTTLWPGFSQPKEDEGYLLDGTLTKSTQSTTVAACLKKRNEGGKCTNRSCDCRKGWTNPTSFPAYALKMGTYINEVGNVRYSTMVYLILTWIDGNDLQRRGRYSRLGLGRFRWVPRDPGFVDPFRHAETTTITLV